MQSHDQTAEGANPAIRVLPHSDHGHKYSSIASPSTYGIIYLREKLLNSCFITLRQAE